MTKSTWKDYQKAMEVIEEFKGREERRIYRKIGIKYIQCQHLKEKTQSKEYQAQWIGETTRIILCPICANVKVGNFVRMMETVVGIAQQEPLEEEKTELKYKDDTAFDIIKRLFGKKK